MAVSAAVLNVAPAALLDASPPVLVDKFPVWVFVFSVSHGVGTGEAMASV